jgi:hypothetical protein
MVIEGKIDVGVPPEVLWDFLLDLERFSACIPGVESVSQVSAEKFTGVIRARVGPVSGAFGFEAVILERIPPRALRVRAEGKDSVTGSAVGTDVDLTLEARAEAGSSMAYRTEVEVSGPLAIIGDMILRATISALMAEFARRLRARIEGEGTRAGTVSSTGEHPGRD